LNLQLGKWECAHPNWVDHELVAVTLSVLDIKKFSQTAFFLDLKKNLKFPASFI